MRHAAGAVLQLASDRRWVGGRPGILAVLHTWTRTLTFHPHVHLLVTSGGMVEGEGTWIRPANPRFLLPGYVLSRIFRGRVLRDLSKAELELSPPPPRNERWVVHVQHAGDGRKVLDYLARYVHRVALTNRSIVAADDRGVTVRYVHTRTRERRLLTLEPVDFVARFLQHVLPKGFVKVRYSGLFSSPCKERRELARELLLREAAETLGTGPSTSESSEPVSKQPRLCPVCRRGHLHVAGSLPRKPTWSSDRSPRGPP